MTKAKVAQAYGQKEIKAPGDFFKGSAGDFALARSKLREDFVDRGTRGSEGEGGEIGDGPVCELYRERFRAKALAVTNVAESGGHVLSHPLAIGVRVGFLEIAVQEFQDAVKAETLFGADFFAFRIGHGGGCGATVGRRPAVEDEVLHARGLLFERDIQIEAVRVCAELNGALEKRGTGTGA